MAADSEDERTRPGWRASRSCPEPAHPRYEVRGELGRGGLGRVLAAHDRRLDRPVALKELLGRDADSRARFDREVNVTARLQHPSIVPLYDVDAWPAGEPFYAMKIVSGRTLDRVIAEAGSLDERLALLPHVIAVAEAVAYAHGEGIIHRDLKPANVLVGAFGETVVIDWGLAKDLRAGEPDRPSAPSAGPGDATVAGTVLGTPAYMPPEQAHGDPVDERADVYALGALLYHVLAGAKPFGAGSADATLAAVAAGPPPPLAERQPGVARDLVTIVEKAMARAPAARYPTARELAEDLRRFATGQLVKSHVYSPAAIAWRFLRKNRAAVLVAAVMLGVLAVAAVVGVRQIVHERNLAEQQRGGAEKLVGFVMSTLRDRLEHIGRADLLKGIGVEVDRYYQAVPVVDPRLDAAGLANRAAALKILAEARYDPARDAHGQTGDLRGAVAMYRASAARTAASPASRSPCSSSWPPTRRPNSPSQYGHAPSSGWAAASRSARRAPAA